MPFQFRLRFLVFLLALPVATSAGENPVADTQDADTMTTSESDFVEKQSAATRRNQLQFSFQEAAWPEVLAWFAEQADLTLDLTDTPAGTFNYLDDRDHSVEDALDVLNGYLLPRGYVLLRRDQFLVSLRTDNPTLPNLIPSVPVSALDSYGDNELLRTVVSVEGLDLEKVAEQLTNVLGEHGKANALDASSSLVLQGFGRSLRESVELLNSAIIPPADDQLEFRAIALQHIPATDAERQIQNLFGLGSNPFRASMARRESYYNRGRRDDRERDGERSSGPVPLLQNMAMNMKVSALPHSNSLLVTATPAAIKLVEDILSSIDMRPPGAGMSVLTDTTPVLRVYTVDEADEDDVAETVDAVMPGVVINEDGRHDSIHVLATPAEHKKVEELIRTIDSGGAGGGVEVIRLTRSDPIAMSDLLTSLFVNEDRDDRPVITPDLTSASLVIRATASQMAEIRSALTAFGERVGQIQIARTGGRFRRLRLQNSVDAERIARIVEKLKQDDQQFRNEIRVVVPSREPSAPAASETSGEEVGREGSVRQPMDFAEPERVRIPSTMNRSSIPFNDAIRRTEKPGRDRSSSQAAHIFLPVSLKKSAESSPVPQVTIEVRDGELFLYSNDDVALDDIEDTIRELMRQMPSRRDWTVFYLRAAAAEDTAQNLVEFLRDDAYPAPLIGLGSDTPVSGTQPMRIIPDARTNALFVSGSPSQMEMVSRFLRLLDTTDLPMSLRDRVPRPIPVEHADVNAVADMIRELYKDFMEDPAERRRQARRSSDDRERNRNDDREALVTAVASQTPGLRPPGIRLTMAVDEETKTLLVSSNEQLYEQIRELVRQRDQAVLESRPSVSVIRVNRHEVPYLKSMLDNLSPQITVSKTAAEISTDRGSRSSEVRGRREQRSSPD